MVELGLQDMLQDLPTFFNEMGLFKTKELPQLVTNTGNLNKTNLKEPYGIWSTISSLCEHFTSSN